jgi:preprotein translocase subunit SecG
LTVLLVIFYVLVCLFLVMVVLLQQGKGADLAGAFGGGGSQTSFGPRTTTNIMHRLTTVSFVLFVVLSMSLAILSGKRHKSVIEDMAAATPTPAAVEPAAQEPALAAPIEEDAERDQAPGDEPAPASD